MTHPAAAREIVDQVVKDVLADFTTGPGGYTLSFRDGAWTDAIATALATAEAAGWRAGRDAVVALAQDGALPIGCTADEATGVVRRTRDAIAAAGSALTPPRAA